MHWKTISLLTTIGLFSVALIAPNILIYLNSSSIFSIMISVAAIFILCISLVTFPVLYININREFVNSKIGILYNIIVFNVGIFILIAFNSYFSFSENVNVSFNQQSALIITIITMLVTQISICAQAGFAHVQKTHNGKPSQEVKVLSVLAFLFPAIGVWYVLGRDHKLSENTTPDH